MVGSVRVEEMTVGRRSGSVRTNTGSEGYRAENLGPIPPLACVCLSVRPCFCLSVCVCDRQTGSHCVVSLWSELKVNVCLLYKETHDSSVFLLPCLCAAVSLMYDLNLKH